jgi:hypothetical protein
LGWQPYHNPVPLSCNLRNLTSWNHLGHSRPVTGLILFFILGDSPAFEFYVPTFRNTLSLS